MNLDFADVRTVMKDMGEAMMGTGRAEGDEPRRRGRARGDQLAAARGRRHPRRPRRAGQSHGRRSGHRRGQPRHEYVQEAAGPQAHVIFGYGIDESLGDELQVTVIATGFTAGQRPAEPPVTVRAAARVEAAPTPAPVTEAVAPTQAPTPAVPAAPAPAPAAAVVPPPAARPAPDSFFVAPTAAPAPPRRIAPAPEPALAWAEEAAPPAARRLAAAAAAAGGDDFLVNWPAAPERPDPLQPFLTPLDPVAPPTVTAATGGDSFGAPVARTSPFLSDALMADLSEPAYTRKYLD